MRGFRIAIAASVGLLVGSLASFACAPRASAPVATTPPASPPQLGPPAAARPRPSSTTSGELHGRLDGRDREAWIALTGGAVRASVSATSAWRVDELGGKQKLVRGAGGEAWRIERRDALLRVAGDGDDATPWRSGPLVARATEGGFVQYEGRRYRGELWFTATDTGILVVNRLPVEDYLRGVVPLELGTRRITDRAALEAQAIAARSYSYVRVPSPSAVQPASGWHMLATVTNQVYGGVEVEHLLVNQAIDATTGLVLRYGGLTVDAPYYSACGGKTAVPSDAWRDAHDQPYLRSVDDTDQSTGKPYCDINPRNHWIEELGEQQVNEAVRRALVSLGSKQQTTMTVRDVTVGQRTASGRVGALVFRTDRGDVTIRARDVRAVLGDARGAILSSTYFSVDREARSGGRVTGLTLRGNGNGHGVGMCQWGAIGRARAGQDARTILQHYYPGTAVGFAD